MYKETADIVEKTFLLRNEIISQAQTCGWDTSDPIVKQRIDTMLLAATNIYVGQRLEQIELSLRQS